jgi:hypothetical protein
MHPSKLTLSLIIIISLFLLTLISAKINSPDFEWEKFFDYNKGDDPFYDIFRFLLETDDGGLILVGTTSVESSPLNRSEDVWIIKLDSKGKVKWDNVYGGLGNDEIEDIIKTDDGGYIFVGKSNYKSYYNAWIIKLNSIGKIEWDNSFNFVSTSSTFKTIAKTPDGNYLVLGIKESYSNDPYYWLVVFDSNGNIIQERSSDDPGFLCQRFKDGCKIFQISGDYFVHQIGRLSKFNSSGDILWTKPLKNFSFREGYDIVKVSPYMHKSEEDNLLFSGVVGGPKDFSSPFNVENSKVYLLTVDDDGNEVEAKMFEIECYNTEEGNNPYPIVKKTGDGGYIISGVDGIYGEEQPWVLKMYSNGLYWKKNTSFISSGILETSESSIVGSGIIVEDIDIDIAIFKTKPFPQCLVENNCINISFPEENKVYSEKRVPFDITLGFEADELFYSYEYKGKDRKVRLCKNCDSYHGKKSFKDGFYNISFGLIENDDVVDRKEISFFVDSKTHKT